MLQLCMLSINYLRRRGSSARVCVRCIADLQLQPASADDYLVTRTYIDRDF
jgi:hypothetical protein